MLNSAEQRLPCIYDHTAARASLLLSCGLKHVAAGFFGLVARLGALGVRVTGANTGANSTVSGDPAQPHAHRKAEIGRCVGAMAASRGVCGV